MFPREGRRAVAQAGQEAARSQQTSLETAGSRRTETLADVVGGFRVDPHWRSTHGGLAVRLDARTTISVEDPVGRWREVDPRRPYDAWRSVGKAIGFVTWSAALGIGWWAGTRRGTGPLGVLRHR